MELQLNHATCGRTYIACDSLFDKPDQVTYSLSGGATGRRNFLRLGLDLAMEVHADGLIDFRFRREEAIDIGRRHMQFTRNVGDRRLLESDLPEQALRYLDNQLMSVLFLGFSLRPHILTVQISGTIVMARALGFAQIGRRYPFS